MVLKSTSVLSCLLPARFGFGSTHRPDTRNQEKHPDITAHDHQEADHPLLFGRPSGPVFHTDLLDTSRARANTAPSDSFPAHLVHDIGESPNPVHRPFSPTRAKRSSFTTFFAFSSKRKSAHGIPVVHLPQLQRDLLVPPQPIRGRWLPNSSQTDVHLINTSSIPSPLRDDDEEYYVSYASLTPMPSPSVSPHPNIPRAEHPYSRQQDLVGNPDMDSQLSSPVDPHSPHTQIQHPYAYSTPLYSRPHSRAVDAAPSLRHATSQPFHHSHPSDISPTLAHGAGPSSQLGHQPSKSYPQPQLKTSVSTPNLSSRAASVRARSITNKRPSTGSKKQERWLSAETWWDALLSPSPRFKVKQASRPHTAAGRVARDPVGILVQGEPNRIPGIAFPSPPVVRPRAASATSHLRPTPLTLARSRSATDLGQSSAASHPTFEPTLGTLVDEPAPTPTQIPGRDTEFSSPEPPLSLEQVIDEGRAFEQQRAQWKRQASRSLGNKHTRSLSRARSKSLGEKYIHGHGTSESGKAQFSLEFLAARSLLGSQITTPTVHVIKPSNSSSHSKAYSHSHSRSAHSHTQTVHSRAYSHSHSHSLTTSNSSKSSRNPRGHSRSGSWSRTALLKAGSLCGIAQDDSVPAEVPSSSRVDVRGVIHIRTPSNAEGVSDAPKAPSPPHVPIDEVGVAITSTPPYEGSLDLGASSQASRIQQQQGDRDKRSSSKYTHRSSGYAGPHPSIIDSNLPQLAAASTVSLRHRLPPRAAIYPPITPIAHPYRTAPGQPEQMSDKTRESTTSKVTESHVTTEPDVGRTLYPHISLSHPDFARYGVGEALVYASLPRPRDSPEVKRADVSSSSSRLAVPFPGDKSPSRATLISQREASDTASVVKNSPPSLTNSTIQMVMSAFNNPDDLDEFQDLFYKPHYIPQDQGQGSSLNVNQVPIDVRSSESNSPLAHLVRKLSEEASSLRDPLRTPSDSIRLQRSESQDHPASESGTKFVFVDLAGASSSPVPTESPSQMHLPIQAGKESTTQPALTIPLDVDSSYTASCLESPSTDRENDTFGCPIKHGQLEAVTAPSPVQTSIRLSTHLSILEDQMEDESSFLSPAVKRHGLSTEDAIRSSYLTMSDVSQMSGLFDFPLPPNTRPGGGSAHSSLLRAYMEATPSESESETVGHGIEAGTEQAEEQTDGEEDGQPSGDVRETLLALRAPRVTSYESGMTFGESDNDVDVITRLHQARPRS